MLALSRRPFVVPVLWAALAWPSGSAAQRVGTVTDRSGRVDGGAEWAGLVYARAAEAVRSGDLAAVEVALAEIEGLEGGSVDAPFERRALPIDPAWSPAEREAYIVDVVLPYLHPDAAGQSVECGTISTLQVNTFDARGEPEGFAQATLSCSVGPVRFSYVGQRTRTDGGTLDVEGFRFGEVPTTVSILSRGSVFIESDTDHGTLLALAAGSGHAPVVERLMRAGASADGRSAAGRTALMDAAARGQGSTVRALLAGGASVDLAAPDGRSALHFAVEADRLPTVEALLEAGADPSVTDREGRTPLHGAVDDSVATGRMVERLVAAGAPLERETAAGDRALHLALENRHADAALTLLRLGADATAPDGDGRTPLTLAIRSGLDVLGSLVEGGADLDQPDGEGWTALHHAARAADPEMVGEVLALGARVDARATDGSTALMLAAEGGATDVLNLLLRAGAEIEASDDAGNTALHRAARGGRDRTAEALLRAGADRGPRNGNGRSPQDLAGDHGHGGVQSLFRHTKGLHVGLRGAAGFTRLADPQHESSVGWEYGLGLGLKVHERVRLQAEIGWATRTTDPTEEGPVVVQPGSGDFYYAAYSVDLRPTVRVALGNPYRTHLYGVAGMNFSTVEEAEILDWVDTDADGIIVTDDTDTEVASLIGGLGIQATLGRIITSVEILVSRSSDTRLDRFEGPMEAISVGLSFAW